MMKNTRTIILIAGALVLTCACFAVGFRIYLINMQAPVVLSEKYEPHQEIPLNGSFITSSKEMTSGYSVTVGSASLLSYNEYLKKYANDHEPQEIWNTKSIVEVEVTIRNTENSKGYLDVMGWNLIPERGNEYFIVNSSLWQIGEPNAPGDTSALSLVPNSEYTVKIPFVRNVSEDDMLTKEIDDTRFTLVISNAPVKKAAEITVSN